MTKLPAEFFVCTGRRRHTRLQGDWSSDVCSSDLGDGYARVDMRLAPDNTPYVLEVNSNCSLENHEHPSDCGLLGSEERRVGRECSSGVHPAECGGEGADVSERRGGAHQAPRTAHC